MSESKTILVPIDFSDCAMDVVREASTKAEKSGARVVLMHVVRLPEGIDPTSRVRPEGSDVAVGALDHLLEEADQRMPEYVAAAKRHGIDVEVRIAKGDTVDAIVAASKEPGVDEVVMGTHGRKGISKLMLGSVADQVRKLSPRPVQTVATVYKSHCKAGSCAWCATHRSPALLQLHTEGDG